MIIDSPSHEVFYLTPVYSQNVAAARDNACFTQAKVILYLLMALFKLN